MTRQSTNRRCVFCGNSGVTREHAWPAWIARDVFNNAASVEHTIEAQGQMPYSYSSKTFDQTVKQVCRACNNGWMAELEAGAIPLIEPILRGRTQELTGPDQLTAATWILKTALMYHLTGPKAGHEVIPVHHFQTLYEHRCPPESVAILVGYNDVGPLNRIQQFDHFGIQLFLPPLIGDDGYASVRSAYAFTASIGKLAFQVIGVDAPDILIPEMFLKTVAWEPYLVRLWPTESPVVRWPPPRLLGHGQLEALATRFGRPQADGVRRPGCGTASSEHPA